MLQVVNVIKHGNKTKRNFRTMICIQTQELYHFILLTLPLLIGYLNRFFQFLWADANLYFLQYHFRFYVLKRKVDTDNPIL